MGNVCNFYGANQNCGPTNVCGICELGYEENDCSQCRQGFHVTSGANGVVNSTTGEGAVCSGNITIL